MFMFGSSLLTFPHTGPLSFEKDSFRENFHVQVYNCTIKYPDIAVFSLLIILISAPLICRIICFALSTASPLRLSDSPFATSLTKLFVDSFSSLCLPLNRAAASRRGKERSYSASKCHRLHIGPIFSDHDGEIHKTDTLTLTR